MVAITFFTMLLPMRLLSWEKNCTGTTHEYTLTSIRKNK